MEFTFKMNEMFAFTVLVPHLGTATYRTESDMARLAAINVINVLINGTDMIAPAFKLT